MDNKVTLMDNKQGSNGKGPISVYIGKIKDDFLRVTLTRLDELHTCTI